MTKMTSKFLGLLAAAVLLAGCERPPIDTAQQGYRGTAMVHVENPRIRETLEALNEVPEAPPPAPATGPKASEVYQNVQVLGDLSVAQFTRLMTSLTAWVSPEEGCVYCHEANLASDGKYQKIVSRRMIQMTQHINSQWTDHVGNTGVTCYTCHRGKNVPEYIWFEEGPGEQQMFAGNRSGQNAAAFSTAYSSLPGNHFDTLLQGVEDNIRVAKRTALPTDADGDISLKHTERTYGLMMHMSDALGQNCTFCHNSRAFSNWAESSPKRVTAWHGIQMARDLNNDYLQPLQDTYPPHRLGPTGDAPKANCLTCHQGVQKPLYGVSMLGDYESLRGN